MISSPCVKVSWLFTIVLSIGKNMITIKTLNALDFNSIPIDPFWNAGDEKEFKIHRIHSYPARFPAFITTKALEYSRQRGLNPKWIADIFCGCGTVAFEVKRNNINFWGCDINPVATMIAKTKNRKYNALYLERYFTDIKISYTERNDTNGCYENANNRLKYWYSQEQYEDLYKLKCAITDSIPPNSPYRLFFICAFSNILKVTSRWLTKSIKPQVDPDKIPKDVLFAFVKQYNLMFKANSEVDFVSKSETRIYTKSIIRSHIMPGITDLIITSPPYVTSYEYADLHQLSLLWLEHTDDFRKLRKGTIGSVHHNTAKTNMQNLNRTGADIVKKLSARDKSKSRAVARYYLDMQKVVEICYRALTDTGMVFFVIADTEYKGIEIENTRHLAETLKKHFRKVLVTKRKISNKILPPHRDGIGRFTSNNNNPKTYGEEYILVGSK